MAGPRLKPFAAPPPLFPVEGPVNGPLDAIPVVPDPTGRGERAWSILSRLPLTEGEHSGETFGQNSPPWQPRLTKLLFGYTDAEGRRLLREAFINIAKKNGKTAYAAALALTWLLLDGGQREHVVCLAATRTQARIAFDSMCAMIRADPWLAERFEIVEYRNMIRYAKTGSHITAVAAELASLVGLNPSLIVVDELHLLGSTPKGARLVNQGRTAAIGRLEPLIVSISTAPIERSEGVFESTLQKARRVIAGEEVDPSFFAWLCECPKGLDPQDSKNWFWTNPSLGYTISLERLQAAYASAQSDPTTLRDFLSQNLNISPELSSGAGKWMTPERWDAAADNTITLPSLVDEAVSIKIGIDRGGLDDLSAVAVMGRCADGRFLVWVHQWISQQGYEKRKSVIPYDDFAAAGELTVFAGGTGDVVDIVDVVDTAYNSGKLSLIGIDSFGAPDLAEALAPIGADVQTVPQGWRLTPAISWIERTLADDKLRHNGTALMRLNVFNAVLTHHGNAVSISKSSVVGSDKIDGVAALLNATAAHLAKAGDDVGIYMNEDGTRRSLFFLE